MMSNAEKDICRYILNEGDIKKVDEFNCEGIEVKCHVVELCGEEYHITEHDGEIVYMLHC